MNRLPAATVALLASLLGACASAGPLPTGEPVAAAPGPVLASNSAWAPDFDASGRVRRDPATAAPLFLARSASLPAAAPRFDGAGRVSRCERTGAPLVEEVLEGEVVRVLVALP